MMKNIRWTLLLGLLMATLTCLRAQAPDLDATYASELLKPGTPAPDFTLQTPDGKTIQFSDFAKGKYVVIDFWASWCGPCRRESPNVRNVYAKYHDKGFEVFSVSLDRDANNWKKAIKDDKLVWPNHVSDLKYWSSEAAAIYGVRSIPSMFLLDREGRIVAKDLRGEALERAVKQLLEQ